MTQRSVGRRAARQCAPFLDISYVQVYRPAGSRWAQIDPMSDRCVRWHSVLRMLNCVSACRSGHGATFDPRARWEAGGGEAAWAHFPREIGLKVRLRSCAHGHSTTDDACIPRSGHSEGEADWPAALAPSLSGKASPRLLLRTYGLPIRSTRCGPSASPRSSPVTVAAGSSLAEDCSGVAAGGRAKPGRSRRSATFAARRTPRAAKLTHTCQIQLESARHTPYI